MTEIEKGQVWTGQNRTEFYIDDIRKAEEGTWIHYTNTFTQQTYSCLEPAFRQRFSPILNRG
jgi:hypothetical protein